MFFKISNSGIRSAYDTRGISASKILWAHYPWSRKCLALVKCLHFINYYLFFSFLQATQKLNFIEKVQATAIVLFKRFYLKESVVTYDVIQTMYSWTQRIHRDPPFWWCLLYLGGAASIWRQRSRNGPWYSMTSQRCSSANPKIF